MAVTITDTRVLVSDADSTTGWTSSSTITVFTTDPAPVEATGCLGIVVSTATQNIYFTMGAGVNMSAGTLVYVWVLARGAMDTRTNGGIQILLGDGTNRVGYHVGGSDVAGFRHSDGPVGWECYVIDTANLPTQTTTIAGVAASLNLSSITQIGAVFKTLAKSVGGVSNCWVDAIRYGNDGLLITGGTSGDPGTFSQIAAGDRATTNLAAHGIIRELGAGLYGLQGPLTFGSTGSVVTFFRDQNATVVFEDRQVNSNKYKIRVQGNAAQSSTFSLTNCIISVPSSRSAEFIATSANLQALTMSNTQIVGFREGVAFSTSSNGTNHVISNSTFRGCGQVDIGRVRIRDSVFSEYISSGSALLWNANIDIADCQFLNNTSSLSTPAAIEHRATGTFSYNNLTFSTNNYDIFNSSNGLVTINSANGSNPSTSRNTGAGSTVINNAVSITLTNLIAGSEVRILSRPSHTVLDGTENSTTSFIYTYNYVADTRVDIVIIHLNYRYVLLSNFLLPAVSSEIPIQQETDRVYNNP